MVLALGILGRVFPGLMFAKNVSRGALELLGLSPSEQLKCGIPGGPVRRPKVGNAPGIWDVGRRLFPCLSMLGAKKERKFPVGLHWSWGWIVMEKKRAWKVY